MADELTTAGITTKTEAERRADVAASLEINIDPAFMSDETVAESIYIITDPVTEMAETVADVFAAFDPEEAEGIVLDALCAITGTRRRRATYGTVSLRLTLDAGVTVPAGAIAGVGTDDGNRWATTEDAVNSGAGSANVTVEARCTTAGEVSATIGTITSIITPYTGWTAVTNLAAATEGLEPELDPDLRERRERELADGGSATLRAIVADVSAIDGLLEVVGLENTTNRAQNGIAPNSIDIVVWDGTGPGAPGATIHTTIAETIAGTKADGIRAFGHGFDTSGTDEVDVSDDQGNVEGIGFTIASPVDIDLAYNLSVTSDFATADFKSMIEDWGEENLSIGEDVFRARMIQVAYDDPTVVNVTAMTQRYSGVGALGTADLAVDSRSIGRLTVANISVTPTVV